MKFLFNFLFYLNSIQTKKIKPVIEDDRKNSKPNYVQKEHHKDQYSKEDQKYTRQDKTYDRTEDYDRSQ